MAKLGGRDIVHRWEGNPIITMEDVPFPCGDICNAGAVKVGDEYVLLVTIRSLEGFYSIYPARSEDGRYFEVDGQSLLSPSCDPREIVCEEMGVMDPRVTFLDGVYYVMYDAYGATGYRLGLCKTTDLKSAERIGLISEPDTKGGALFPAKIDGRYARLERPWHGGSIWISFSDDLLYWGWSRVVMTARGGFWDCSRVGAATPPMEIERGWLVIYYAVKDTSSGPLFRLGAVILDKERPWEVVGRTNIPILSPLEEYERIGDMPNLVFSCGAITEPNGELKLYYGASNACICMGTTKVSQIVAECLESKKEF